MKPAFGSATPRMFLTSMWASRKASPAGVMRWDQNDSEKVGRSQKESEGPVGSPRVHMRKATTIEVERETPCWQCTKTAPPVLSALSMKVTASYLRREGRREGRRAGPR